VPFIPPVKFTVSQLRVAAACPRILYFDADDNRRRQRRQPKVTRIWESGGTPFAAGSLFHQAVEKFNREASRDSAVADLVAETAGRRDDLYRGLMRIFTQRMLNRQRLIELPAEVIHNFTRCIEIYFGELADIVHCARSTGQDAAAVVRELFADLPKRVDVTLHVGPQQQPVHVAGRLDYAFFDRRTDRLRILDYKLAPASNPDKDLFQAATYALLYHHQHGYQSDVGVLYLHPQRQLVDMSWEQVHAARHKVYDLLASMVDWAKFDPEAGIGLKPRGELAYCAACRWRTGCEARLGVKSLGDSHHGWSESRSQAEPQVIVAPITAMTVVEPDEELIDEPEEEPPPPSATTSKPLTVEKQPTVKKRPQPGDKVGIEAAAAAPAGTLALGRTLPAGRPVLIEKRHLSTHTAIVGAAGSGKTYFAKAFVEEAILSSVPVLAIDPQGDLAQFLRLADADADGSSPPTPDEERNRQQWQERRSRYRDSVETRIYTPGTSHGTRLSLSPIRLPAEEELAGLPSHRRQEEHDALIAAIAYNLTSLTMKGKRNVDQSQTFLARILRGLIRAQSTGPATAGASGPAGRSIAIGDIAAAVYAPEGIGIDDADMLIKKGERENLSRQLYALAHGPLAPLFTGGTPLDIDQLRVASQPGKTPLNVIYLNALDEPAKHAFLAALATEVYRWMTCNGGDPHDPQLLFYLDEAKVWLPAGASDPPAKQPIIRLFTQGRKYGVGCLICTQSPRSVDYNIFGNCSTKLIGRLETPQDAERVAEWFSTQGAKPAWIAGRSGADQGTFIGRWPDQPSELQGAVFKSRPLFSLHEGAWSPERVEQEVHRAGD